MDFQAKKYLRSKLSESRNSIYNTIENLSANQLEKKISSNKNAWSIIQVIRHLVSAEYGQTKLIDLILEGGEGIPGVPENFDLDRYNKSQVSKLSIKSLAELLTELKKNRIYLLRVLERLNIEDFKKKGRHASLHILSIEEILHVIADHETGHLRKIQNALDNKTL